MLKSLIGRILMNERWLITYAVRNDGECGWNYRNRVIVYSPEFWLLCAGWPQRKRCEKVLINAREIDEPTFISLRDSENVGLEQIDKDAREHFIFELGNSGE